MRKTLFYSILLLVLTVSQLYSQTMQIKPAASVYVKGGNASDSNFVNDTLLRVRGSVYDSLKRVSYLKFDLHAYSGVVGTATLKLVVNRVVAITGGGQNRADIFSVTNDNWAENTVTWNTAPQRQAYMFTQNFKQKISTNPDTTYSIDITSLVRSEYAGDKVITICMVDTTNNNTDVRIWSGRNTASSPVLEISSSASGNIRYRDEIFSSYTMQSDIQYGSTASKILYLDLYQGTGDTEVNRPLIIYLHGGAFKGGDKDPNSGAGGCGYLTHFGYGMAKRGYVVASINYRTVSSWTGDQAHMEIMLKDIQDTKAAIRFFRKNAALYGIDTNRIILCGQSAGAHIALHTTYLDSTEVPSYVSWANVGGTFEGTSGNPGYSTKVAMCISNWGALIDTTVMQAQDVPIYCVHGTADTQVPYIYGTEDSPMNYGSVCVNKRAASLKIKTGLTLYTGYGHSLDSDDAAQEDAYQKTAAWVYTALQSPAGLRQNNTGSIRDFTLLQNYPNPCNPSTRIAFTLSRESPVTLKVYSMLGSEAAVLFEGVKSEGRHEIDFNTAAIPSGVYIYKLQAGSMSLTRKLVVLK